jgi:chorismate synthase
MDAPVNRRPLAAQRAIFCAIKSRKAAKGYRDIEMDSEKVAGILGAIVAAVILVVAIAFGPIGQIGKPQKPAQKAEQPAQPATAPAKGPVVREVPQ